MGHPGSPFWRPGATFGATEKEVEKKTATGGVFAGPGGPKSGLRGAGGRVRDGKHLKKRLLPGLTRPVPTPLRSMGGRIQRASSSPPGQISKSNVQVRVPSEFTFRFTFGVILLSFGVIFEVVFGPWGHFGGAVGSLFG